MKKCLTIVCLVLIFFGLLCLLWQISQPLNFLNRISLYNIVFPGRERLPFGENPQMSYNFSIGSLDAAFASHKISNTGTNSPDTFRIITIGDSSSWGTLQRPEETLCGRLNGKLLPDGKSILCYNLAYPTLSLTKDYLLLNRAMHYEPDLILWPLTLESFPIDKQTDNALIQANWDEYCSLFPESKTDRGDVTPVEKSVWGQRRETADWLRLQLYGLMWAGTGIDQDYPESYTAPQIDLNADNTYHGISGPLKAEDLAWDVLEKGFNRAENVPVMLINEPMLISNGENSKIRYNYYYPREAYDSWHQELISRADKNDWLLVDLWNYLDIQDFTNSAIHYNADSAVRLADIVFAEIERYLYK